MKKMLFFLFMGLLLLARNGPVFAASPDYDAAQITICQDMDYHPIVVAEVTIERVFPPPAEFRLPYSYGMNQEVNGLEQTHERLLRPERMESRASVYDEIIFYTYWQISPQVFSAASGNT